MVATDTNGRNNQISAKRDKIDEQGFLADMIPYELTLFGINPKVHSNTK